MPQLQNKDKDINGFDAESDTATAESGQSPPLTMSPLIQTHSNSMTGTGSGLGRPTSNSKLINPSAALQLSQTLAAMHSLRSMQQARTSLLAGKYYHTL